jgi:hypothetical protein
VRGACSKIATDRLTNEAALVDLMEVSFRFAPQGSLRPRAV